MTKPLRTSNEPTVDQAGVISSPIKTPLVIPKLKLRLHVSSESIVKQAPAPSLPKITLSVRRPDNVENVENVEDSNQVKRKRGRPPKSLKMEISDSISRKHTEISRPMAIIPPRRPLIHCPQKPLLPAAPTHHIDPRPKVPLTVHSTIGDAELTKISRLKGHLSTLIDTDLDTINHADYHRPFTGKQDIIDRLLPFHLLALADIQTPISIDSSHDISTEIKQLCLAFNKLVQTEDERTIPTELRLLEQKLCLEEEKFLLEKMRAEFKRRSASQ